MKIALVHKFLLRHEKRVFKIYVFIKKVPCLTTDRIVVRHFSPEVLAGLRILE